MQISHLEIDDRNEAHVIRHGISLVEIGQVFANGPEIRLNRGVRSGTHVARGKTDGGLRVLIPFVDKGEGLIRPITAWEAGK